MSNFLESFIQANNFLIQGHIDEAIALYSSLLSTEQNFDLLINRSVAYIKKGDYNLALCDSESAILQDPNRYEGYYYRGIANFSLAKFQVALSDFSEAKAKKIPSALINTWIPKCNLELRLEPKKKTNVNENPEVSMPKPPLQTEKDEKNEKKEEQKEEEEPHFDVVKEKIFTAAGVLNYSWYQTDKHVGLEWDQKIESKEVIQHVFDVKKVSIKFPIQGSSKPYELTLDLWDEIKPETARIILSLTKLEIKFEKKNQNKNWVRLESEDKPKKIMVQEIEKAPSYPTSSKYKKDWNKIDRDLEEELSKENDEDALNKVFKEIYKNADENTRRAMIKSFQTSGGTVL